MVYLKQIKLINPDEVSGPVEDLKYPYKAAAVRYMDELVFTRPVTFLVGENGIGKSTLLEAVMYKYERRNEDLQGMLNDGDESNDPYIISVRSAEDYAKGHIPGAVNYDPKTMFTPEVLATIPTDKPIVVYCYTGQTASQVVSSLNLLGYDASNLVHGMSMWSSDPNVFVKRFDPEKTPKNYPVEAGN